jgi:Ca-activated chloride channel homolog
VLFEGLAISKNNRMIGRSFWVTVITWEGFVNLYCHSIRCFINKFYQMWGIRMQFAKRGVFLLFMMALVLIIGCSKEATMETRPQKEEAAPVEKENSEMANAARTLESTIEQKPGKLVEEHIEPDLETVNGWNGMDYNNYYNDTFQPLSEKEMRTYFEKNKDLTADQVYDYLVYQLGSGMYKEYYKELVSYDHGFVMPELPEAADAEVTKQKKMNVVVLMDASGSMKQKVTGGVKMDLAKETIGKFMEQIPAEAQVSLLAYGHLGTGKNSDKAMSCAGVDAVYPLGEYKQEPFKESLNSFAASGWTPLAGGIEKVATILESYNTEEYYNMVYIVSDGIETCDGDPVAAAKKLQDENIKAKVNIIGFDVDDQGQQQLKKVADAGAGEYVTVQNQSELETHVLKKWKPTIGQLVWTQGVGLKETIKAMERMNNIFNPLYYATDRERNRIRNAAYYLNTEELISEEVEGTVLKTADEMYDLRYNHFKEIKDKKEAEMWAAHKQINDEVKAWREKWQAEL